MREIKFRVVFAGKIINSKDYNLVCDLAENKWYLEMFSQGGEFCESREDFELQRYTGLKDRNGKEIYEGDIISIADSHGDIIKHEIKWIDDDARFGAVNINYPTLGGSLRKEWIDTCGFIVIGNIYENPELLE